MKRQIAATRHSNTSHQQIASCEQGEFYRNFFRYNRILLLQHFAQNWFDFARHVAATKFCRGDKILINQPPNVEAFKPGNLLLQSIAAISAYDLSLHCTHKGNCCSNVLQRFVASCVPALTLQNCLNVYCCLRCSFLKWSCRILCTKRWENLVLGRCVRLQRQVN